MLAEAPASDRATLRRCFWCESLVFQNVIFLLFTGTKKMGLSTTLQRFLYLHVSDGLSSPFFLLGLQGVTGDQEEARQVLLLLLHIWNEKHVVSVSKLLILLTDVTITDTIFLSFFDVHEREANNARWTISRCLSSIVFCVALGVRAQGKGVLRDGMVR